MDRLEKIWDVTKKAWCVVNGGLATIVVTTLTSPAAEKIAEVTSSGEVPASAMLTAVYLGLMTMLGCYTLIEPVKLYDIGGRTVKC